jgi:hypothetical protein
VGGPRAAHFMTAPDVPERERRCPLQMSPKAFAARR